MNDEENIVRIYSGTEASVLILKALLEEAGVSSLIKNDSSSAFLGAVPGIVDLYIEKKDLKRARPLIEDFIHNNQQ
jgi:hypothetical protein